MTEVEWCNEDDCPNVAGTDGLCRAHRKKFRASKIPGLDEYVRRIVDEAPPLTPAQKDQLSMIIHRSRKATR